MVEIEESQKLRRRKEGKIDNPSNLFVKQLAWVCE